MAGEDERIGEFACTICDRYVSVGELGDIEDFRVGTYLICSKCIKRVIPAVVNKIIADTSIPKTYRSMFGRYLEWRKDK